MDSWRIYENYTAPLGVGWMVNPRPPLRSERRRIRIFQMGTYHFADCHGIGVDRTVKTGTGYTAQYHKPNANVRESGHCPDELLLFFHHVPYTHRLHSGKTVIQHIYDTHFEGAEQARGLVERWESLEGKVDEARFQVSRNGWNTRRNMLRNGVTSSIRISTENPASRRTRKKNLLMKLDISKSPKWKINLEKSIWTKSSPSRSGGAFFHSDFRIKSNRQKSRLILAKISRLQI